MNPCCQWPADLAAGNATGIVLLKTLSDGAATKAFATSLTTGFEWEGAGDPFDLLRGDGGLRSGASDLIVDVRLAKLGQREMFDESSHRSLLDE